MASICSNTNTVSVSCGTKTVILRLNDLELFPFSHPNIQEIHNVTVAEDSLKMNKVDNEDLGLGLLCCDISSCGSFLAFCTLMKNLCIVDINKSKPSVVKVYRIARGASKVKFTPINNHVVIADKSGDVYLFKPKEDSAVGQLILGHLSLLLDILITPDEKFIISCDRDEKIRISSYPNGYNINGYCLGHSEFVSSLCLLPHSKQYLISTSGDGTMRFWDYKVGAELIVCNVSTYFVSNKTEDNSEGGRPIAAITDAAALFVDSKTSVICVCIVNFSVCSVFKCTSDDDGLHCNLSQNISLGNSHPWRLSISSNILWSVYSCNENVLVKANTFNLESCKFEDNLPASVEKAVEKINSLKMIIDQKKNIVDLLFKRKFENVQEYLKKKELRFTVQEPPNKKVKP